MLTKGLNESYCIAKKNCGGKNSLNCCGNVDDASSVGSSVKDDAAPLTGNSEIGFQASSIFEGPTCTVDIEFKEIVHSVKINRKENKPILKGISGKFHGGELTAVLGPSGMLSSLGVPKCWEINIVEYISRIQHISSRWKILINGVERNLRSFRKMSCYIMQDDCLMPNLSVLESMMVSANLHLKEALSVDEKREVINEILSALGLAETAHTCLNEISGGQRKRLAIALELVNNPPVIFLDEPTSGLDSLSAFHCINLMKSLAESGRNIICTIHQPSAKLFERFDKLYILSSGHCIYSGGLPELLPYLQKENLFCPKYHNRADFIIEVASGEYGDVVQQLVKAWKIQEKRKELDCLISSNFESDEVLSHKAVLAMLPSCRFKSSTDSLKHAASQTTQFAVLTKRAMISIIRDRMFTHLRLFSVIFVAVLIGLLYFGIGNDGNKVINNTGCLFFSMLFLMFIALMPTVLTFPMEKVVFIREHLNNWYSLKSYYLAKTVADLPFQILLPLIYCTIVYFMTSQPNDPQRYVQYTAVTVLTCLVAQSIGLLLGAVAPSVPTAVFVAPVTGIPVLLFSGFFVNFDTIPKYLQWLTYVSFARYSWEGMIVAIYGNNRGALDCDGPRCIFRTSEEVLDVMDVEETALFLEKAKFYFDCVVLSMFFITLRLVTYLVLRYKVKGTQVK